MLFLRPPLPNPGFGAINADYDQQHGVIHDPPNCYFEDGSLKYNLGGNTGACNAEDVCLCRHTVIAVPECERYCDSEVESFTQLGSLLLLGYVVAAF